MRYFWMKCKEVEISCDGDNAIGCPECCSVDCFKEIDEENEE